MQNEKEIWKDVPGYEGLYKCSNLGRIKSLGNEKSRKEKILKPHLNDKGYNIVGLTKNKKAKLLKVHQVVAITFLGHKLKESNLVVDHIDGVKSNNKVENLRLVTFYENLTSCYRTYKSTFNNRYYKVYFDNSKIRFKAFITINKKYIFIGSFKSRIEAENICIEKFNSIKIENI